VKRCCTRPIWSKTRTSAPLQPPPPHWCPRTLNAFLDGEGRYEIGQEVLPVDALKFKDSRKYPERLKEALENTGETDALMVMGGASWALTWWRPALNLTSWAAAWAAWWASALCAA
jgi:hypothetical protein